MRDILGRYLGQGAGTILQVGAARGDLLETMRAANPARIVLLEADPDLAAALARRIAGHPRETLIRAALSPHGPARQRYYARSLPGLGGLCATNARMQRLLPGLALRGRPMVDVLHPAALLDRLAPRGAANWLILEAAGLEGDILAALQEDGRLRQFQTILLRAPRAALFNHARPAAAIVAAMKEAGYEALAPPLGDDPDWPCHLLRLNPLWEALVRARADNAAEAQQLDTLKRKLTGQRLHAQKERAALESSLHSAKKRLEAAARTCLIAQKDLEDMHARAPTPAHAPQPDAPLVRSIHHFACTGGTLITRHLAALPNVLTLSEIDPLSTFGQKPTADGRLFAPSDLLALLRHSPRAPDQKVLVSVFQEGLAALLRDTVRRGQHLLLRDHAHSQFCTDCDWRQRPTLLQMLAARYQSRALITVRHPLDSYLSLAANGWRGFAPPTLAEYSRRYLAFLKAHAGLEIIRYEDFVAAPDATLARLCAALDLPVPTEAVTPLLPAFPLSGDSGRSGRKIAPRPRRPMPAPLAAEIAQGGPAPYRALCAQLGYDAKG